MGEQVDLAVVRYKLAHLAPYLAPAIWALKPVPTEFGPDGKTPFGTFGVDKHWRLYYDPNIGPDHPSPSSRWSLDEQVTCLIHEVSHLLRKHHDRSEMSGSDCGTCWNIASDMEINDDFRTGDWHLPAMCIQPDVAPFNMPTGLMAEEYYDHLPQSKDGKGHGHGKGQGGLDGQSCGSGAGNPQDFEQDGPEAGGPDGINDLEGNAIREQVAEEINRQRGNVPGGLARWADGVLHPKVPWQKYLKGAVRRAVQIVSGADDYTWSRPSRRDHDPFILPKPISRKPTVVIQGDTSGSITAEQLSSFAGMAYDIVKHHSAGVHLLAVDAAVQNVGKANTPGEIKRFQWKGGGGTDMGVGIKHIETEIRPRPNILIVFTDGYTPWPESKPRGMEVVIVIANGGDRDVETPGWARRIDVDS